MRYPPTVLPLHLLWFSQNQRSHHRPTVQRFSFCISSPPFGNRTIPQKERNSYYLIALCNYLQSSVIFYIAVGTLQFCDMVKSDYWLSSADRFTRIQFGCFICRIRNFKRFRLVSFSNTEPKVFSSFSSQLVI